jgi:hypothetical protein
MKTAVLTLYLAVMVLSHHIGHYTAAAQAPFTLIDSRDPGSNIITLRCRNSNVFDPQALYFLNGTRLDSLDGFKDTNEDPGIVVFQMNRRLEGEYSCGTELLRSPSLSFIGKLSICYKDSLVKRSKFNSVLLSASFLKFPKDPGACACNKGKVQCHNHYTNILYTCSIRIQ